jgi:hypothetical protein
MGGQAMIRQLEPCESCGDDTAAGTALYAGRREATDPKGRRIFLCAPCAELAVAARRREPLSEEDRRKLESGAAVFGSFAPGGH